MYLPMNKQTGKNTWKSIQRPIFLLYEELFGTNKQKTKTQKRKVDRR